MSDGLWIVVGMVVGGLIGAQIWFRYFDPRDRD